MFEYTTTIKMHDTDAAGVMFFANQFKLVHDAYEAFMENGGLGLAEVLKGNGFALPIIHAETDYNAPLRVGDKVSIRLQVKHIGTSSFTLSHEIYKEDICAGAGETVHVSISRKDGNKIPLPEKVLAILK